MKSTKALAQISVVTTVEAEDAVTELLASMFGAPASAYFDLERQTSRVSVFLAPGSFSPIRARKEIAAGLRRIKEAGLDTAIAKIEVKRVKRQDWAESWKKHFKPIKIKVPTYSKPPASGRSRKTFRSLLIKPSWKKASRSNDQAVVILDPGLSFGTGQHPTTLFCLHEIAQCLKSGKQSSFLDIGTGSGILAIAAAKLGCAPVIAFDFDPESIRVAKENARKNRVSDAVMLTRSDITKLPVRSKRQFDLVCANLISTLLIAESERIANRVKKGGTLVLAGILATEFTEVEKAYAARGFRLRSSRTKKEWRSGAFCFA